MGTLDMALNQRSCGDLQGYVSRGFKFPEHKHALTDDVPRVVTPSSIGGLAGGAGEKPAYTMVFGVMLELNLRVAA